MAVFCPLRELGVDVRLGFLISAEFHGVKRLVIADGIRDPAYFAVLGIV